MRWKRLVLRELHDVFRVGFLSAGITDVEWPKDFQSLSFLLRPGGQDYVGATLMKFERLMGAGAVDFVQPSVVKMGGVTELCKVFPIAAVRNVTLMPHVFYDGPGRLAAIYVTAALGTADAMIEWRCFDLEAELYGSALSLIREYLRT